MDYSGLVITVGIILYGMIEYRRREHLHKEAMAHLKCDVRPPDRTPEAAGLETSHNRICGSRGEIMMALGVYVAAVLVALVFDRQERRHRFEMRFKYERLGWETPAAKARISKLEALLDMVVGLFFFDMGGILLYTFLILGSAVGASGGQYIVALFLTVGIAMMIVGGKALYVSGDLP